LKERGDPDNGSPLSFLLDRWDQGGCLPGEGSHLVNASGQTGRRERRGEP
jgi:hypothetical protein